MKTHKKFSTLSFLLVGLSVFPARSEVNMKDGSYFKKFTDLIISEKYKLTRTYNSRSLYRGHFGKGWCSDLDRAIDSSNAERVLLVDCSIEKDILYVKEFSTAQVHQGGTFRNRSPQSETVFYTNPETGEKLVLQDNQYVRHSLDGSTLRFFKNGKLKEILSKEGYSTTVEYQNENINQIRFGSILWTASYDASQKVIRALSNGSQKIQYAFEDGKLSGFRTNSQINSQTYRYKYNNSENLTDIRLNDQNLESITYNNTKDLVQSVQTQNGCLETYNFQTQSVSETDQYTSTLNRTCKGIQTHFAYEFYHRYRPDGVKYLELMRVRSHNSVTEIYYHPQLGYPVLVNTKTK